MSTVHRTDIPTRSETTWNCPHQPPCPGPGSADHDRAAIRAAHPEQGWSLLCNGVIFFADTGELLPDGRGVSPHRVGWPAAT
jgi:hypothetical protein